MSGSWQSIAERKQAARNALIPTEWKLKSLPDPDVESFLDIPRSCGLLSVLELDITENFDATSLAEAIRTKKFSCVEVTRAFCKRAAIAQQLTNCLTEILFESAFSRAKYLDDYLAQYGKPVGPLHGVPISLKDSFRVAGVDSSIGMATFCFKPSPSTSPLVSILLTSGAVIYCKTNVPQTLMTLDSINNIFGRTLNPINCRVTAGGSSGGEGALIAMRGSILGVGTDIGGSIRIPAACNGLYGIKPSANRVPYADQEGGGMPGLGKLGIESSAGPIATSLRDCELFLRTVAAARPWHRDPSIIPGFWNSMDTSVASQMSGTVDEVSPKLTIGVLLTDGVTTPLPPISRVLESVLKAVQASGHHIHLINSPPFSLRTAQSLANALFEIEGGNTMLDHLERYDEPLIPWLQTRMRRKTPATLARAASLQAQRERFMTEMLALWQTPSGAEIDAILFPIAPHPIPEIDRWNAAGYTSMWTLLDYPAGSVPVRRFIEEDLQGGFLSATPIGSWDRRNRELWEEDKTDRKVYLGTPLSVQVIAPRLQEKRLCKAMQAVDDACKTHIRKPGQSIHSNLNATNLDNTPTRSKL